MGTGLRIEALFLNKELGWMPISTAIAWSLWPSNQLLWVEFHLNKLALHVIQ